MRLPGAKSDQVSWRPSAWANAALAATVQE
jgi:hypothetical protein